MPLEFHTASELAAAIGKSLGATDWLTVDQARIDQFADATDDHQWIHVDIARAKDGPFASTIAHGYLTLSLVNALFPQLIRVPTAALALNRGCHKVRFPAPVPSGSRIRALGELLAVDEVSGGVDVVVRVTIEIEGHAKAACVAETVRRFLAGPSRSLIARARVPASARLRLAARRPTPSASLLLHNVAEPRPST